MKPLFRTIHPEVKVIDAGKGIVEYVASDESIDSYREVIKADGWRFTRFKHNAPFVDSHDYSCIDRLLGKVVEFRVEKNQLIERVQWAIDVEDCKLAKLGFKMTEAGYLKAVSVGFFPVRLATKWDSDPQTFQTALNSLNLSPVDASRLTAIYLEHEQIELSACIIGANPNALAKSFKAGVLTEEDMVAIGDMADADPRFQISADITHETRLPANKPADAERLTRQREREVWLRDFKQLTNG